MMMNKVLLLLAMFAIIGIASYYRIVDGAAPAVFVFGTIFAVFYSAILVNDINCIVKKGRR
jgi:hypothetical protein